tara:strand:- start:289 stop:459 length:171 start_codon:yes stop_codon:yes gene_type:complete
MMALSEFCSGSTTEELHDMIRHVKEKPRWERTEASYVMLQAAIKELIRRKLIVQTG